MKSRPSELTLNISEPMFSATVVRAKFKRNQNSFDDISASVDGLRLGVEFC